MKDGARWAKVAFTLALLLVGRSAFRNDEGYVPLLGDINVAIHETGHYVFMPFGELMMYMGGSIFQVLVPLAFAGYFIGGKPAHRDRFAAAVCVWWAAINVLAVSVYAADARAGQLTLLSGATGEDDPAGHDFYMIFAHLGVLNSDTIYAGRLRALAGAMFAGSVLFAFLFAILPSRKAEVKAEAAEAAA